MAALNKTGMGGLIFAMAAALILFSNRAHAAGAYDGIYTCSVNSSYGSVPQVFVTLNGHTDGQTIFTVVVTANNPDLFGYGIGQINGNSFIGQTMEGRNFDFYVDGSVLYGTVSIEPGGVIPANVSCSRVW